MNTPSKRTIAVASAALLTFAGGTYAVAGGSAPTAITSSVTDKLGDAITAKYPGSTIVGIHSEPGASGFRVEVRKADGTEVHVSVDESYKVTGELKGREGRVGPGMRGGMGMGGMHGRHGGPGGRFDTAALAKTLGVSEDKLTAALEKVRDDLRPTTRPTMPPTKADRSDRRDALAEALAKELGLDASKVKSALEAQRPNRDAAPGTTP
ncbi:MAG: hypothetical protein J7513_13720 [Solirubrobacteraceae bacterium]|nr:hypothetical protein [Solirubrobacteraceae bacterium]